MKNLSLPLILLLLSASWFNCLATPNNPCGCGDQVSQSTPESAPAPLTAVIKGPTEVLAGTLLFLSYEDSVGDNKVWLIDDELKQSSATCGSSIFFAIPKPGKYRFGLIVANKEAQIAYTYHTVLVKAYPGTPPTTDPDPTDPPPTTTPLPLQEITKISREGVAKLTDPTTTVALITALEDVLPKLSSSLPEAKRQVSTTIETTLLFRGPASRSKDWINLWRIPIQNAINAAPPQDTDEYRKIVQAIISGLKT